MKNTIIFDTKTAPKTGYALTFFINENLDFKIKNQTVSSVVLGKIRSYLKILKSKKIKKEIILILTQTQT